jgi:hypothetical protein
MSPNMTPKRKGKVTTENTAGLNSCRRRALASASAAERPRKRRERGSKGAREGVGGHDRETRRRRRAQRKRREERGERREERLCLCVMERWKGRGGGGELAASHARA